MALTVDWIDRGRDPKCAPDPDFPNGRNLDISSGSARSCRADLPYPAARCGIYVVSCPICGQKIGVTTAGRPDDPKSLKIACKIIGEA